MFNPAAERMLGYKEEEVVGKHTPSLWHVEEEIFERAQSLSAQLGVVVQPGFDVFIRRAELFGSEENEWTFVRKDGERRTVLLVVHPRCTMRTRTAPRLSRRRPGHHRAQGRRADEERVHLDRQP